MSNNWIEEHLKSYLQSDGAEGHFYDMRFAGGFDNTPCLLLTTVGRRSGKPLQIPLIYGKFASRYVIIASKGGAPAHPAWYLNLQDQPQVQLQVGAERFTAEARVATGEERRELWDKMVEIYPPYQEYQEKTDREIPVVVLEK